MEDQLNILKSILKANYEIASSTTEIRLYPDLP